MDFLAAPSRGGLIGTALVVLMALLPLGLVAAALAVGPGPVAAVLLVAAVATLPLVAWLAMWLWGYFSLRYTVSRDGIVIHWGATQQVVPIEDITHLLNGRPYAEALSGLRWPGHEVGRTSVVTDDGQAHPTLVFATRPPEEQLLVVTPGLAYAISPADRSAFVDEFRIRSRLGPVQRLTQGTDQPAWARLTLWHDGAAMRLLAIGLVLNLLAFAWLVWHYPALPLEVPTQLSFDPARAVAAVAVERPKPTLWLLPAIGLAGLALNGGFAVAVHRRVRLAALLLLLGAVLLELALGVVLVEVVGG
jgi:hypothetical protein